MDSFLLIVVCVIALLIILINIYLLAVYVHPDDRGFGASLFPKILVVFGLTLSWGLILMLPLDISNTRGAGGGLDMDFFWELAVILTALVLVIGIPFATYYYETDEQKSSRQRMGTALTYTGVALVLFCIVFFWSYAVLGEANLPVRVISMPVAGLDADITANVLTIPASAGQNGQMESLKVNVGVTIYLVAFFSFIGWLLLVFFGGMGLFAIPMDFINAYRRKPVQRKQKEILGIKAELQDKISDLIQMGQSIEEAQKDVDSARSFLSKRSAQTKVNSSVNRFKATVLAVEQDFDIFSAEVNFKSVNPVGYHVQLGVGLALLAFSLIWWLHIALTLGTDKAGFPKNDFLDVILVWIGETLGFSFVSAGIFAAFSVYLLIGVTKGNVKFGLQIPFFFTIHPMKPNETLMNSFLFNVWLILTTSLAIIQCLTNTFSQYARLTSAQFIFNTQIKYMKFFSFFYENNVFEYAFLAWSSLTLIMLVICQRRGSPNKRHLTDKISDKSVDLAL